MGIIMRFVKHWFLLICIFLACGCKAKAQQFRTHAVTPGETLESVAQQYQVTSEDLLRYNKELQPGAALRPNTILVIPTTGSRPVNTSENQTVKTDTTDLEKPIGFQSHRVRKKRRSTVFPVGTRFRKKGSNGTIRTCIPNPSKRE